jgi:hypothetical protein
MTELNSRITSVTSYMLNGRIRFKVNLEVDCDIGKLTEVLVDANIN